MLKSFYYIWTNGCVQFQILYYLFIHQLNYIIYNNQCFSGVVIPILIIMDSFIIYGHLALQLHYEFIHEVNCVTIDKHVLTSVLSVR